QQALLEVGDLLLRERLELLLTGGGLGWHRQMSLKRAMRATGPSRSTSAVPSHARVAGNPSPSVMGSRASTSPAIHARCAWTADCTSADAAIASRIRSLTARPDSFLRR